ncbi:MAG: hypothetical protein IKV45_02880 [Firmicutes bacterium]|nr:hypothetical protein [Bacillota bacterium]
MSMISGPYTDAVVKMIMSEDRRFFDGDVLKNPKGQFGVLYQNSVWVADPKVHAISERDFDVARSQLLRFPEPYEDTFRFTEGDGNIFIPEYKASDKVFLRECGYLPASPKETLIRLEEKEGTEQHPLYPLSCKVGVWSEADALEVARILMHLYD